MSRLIISIVAIIVLLIGYFAFFAGGTQDVVETAEDAASTAADAASDAVASATDAATSVTDILSGAGLGDMSEALSGLNLDGFDTSLLDPASFNLDGLMGALSSAGLSDETATGLQEVLTQVIENPDMLSELLNQIKTALGL